MTTEHPQFIFVEGTPMPQRVLKPLLAFLAPSDSPTMAWSVISFLLSMWSAWYANRSPIEIVLAAALLFDYWTGYLAAERRGEWTWKRGAEGFVVKATLYVGVLIVGWAARILGAGEIVVVALDTSLCCHEGRSIIRNLKNLGVKGLELFDSFLTKSAEQNKARAGVGDSKDQKGE